MRRILSVFVILLIAASAGAAIDAPAAVNAARVTVTYDREQWRDEWLPLSVSSTLGVVRGTRIDPFTSEALLEPGVYDHVLLSWQNGDVRVHVAEKVSISGDVVISRVAADATHAVTLAATDERGEPFPEVITNERLYRRNLRLLLPDEVTFFELYPSITLPAMTGKTLHVSTLTSRYALFVTENFIDVPARRVYVAQHRIARAIDSDLELRLGPADYRSTEVGLHFPTGTTDRSVRILPAMLASFERSNCSPGWCDEPGYAYSGPGSDLTPKSVTASTMDSDWTTTLFMTPELDSDFANGVQFSTAYLGTGNNPYVTTGLGMGFIRRSRDAFFDDDYRFVPALPLNDAREGEGLWYGGGPFLASAGFISSQLAGIYFIGDRKEWRRHERDHTTFRLFDSAGATVTTETPSPSGYVLTHIPAPGSYRAEFHVDATEVAGVVGEATLDLWFDMNRSDWEPPALSSLAIFDGMGRHNARIPVHGAASLVFSAYDPMNNSTLQRPAAGVRVSYRLRGTPAWLPLTVVETDERSNFVFYRVDLTQATAQLGEIELRIEVPDPSDNWLRWTLSPGFRVVPAPVRRRSAPH